MTGPMAGQVHAMALRAPWYVCERDGYDRFDPRSFAPSIQKYDADDFVQRVVTDPRDSLEFDELVEDVWSFAVPRGEDDKPTTLRGLLSPFVLARSNVRKLYQPNHHRFYAITVELFCDAPGLPRPARAGPVEVKFVVRRLRTTFAGTGPDEKPKDLARDLKDLARAAAAELFDHDFPKPPDQPAKDLHPPSDPSLDTAKDLVALYGLNRPDAAKQAAFRAAHADLIAKVGMTQVLEGWYVAPGGKGDWHPVPLQPDDPVPEHPEQELPMWRIPASAAGCAPAQTRSLWFGIIPTYSGELDSGNRPKLDDRTTYLLQCVARRPQPPPRQSCPPLVTWSGPSIRYRLAAFFDPSGTANRRIHVRLPDFASLAARAGDGPSAGGVEFERPAGSQLPAGPLGKIPDSPSGAPGGDTVQTSSFAIELITIVATFVLSLFLPVVVFAFQLWWLLLLKFSWPPTTAVNDLLSALKTNPINGLTDDDKNTLLGLLGVADVHIMDKLFEPDADSVKADKNLGQDLVNSLQPAEPAEPAGTKPLPPVTDPLCRPPRQ